MKNGTIREAWQKASSFLQQSGTDSPQFEAEYMMRRLLGVERAAFFAKMADPWPKCLEPKLREWLKRRGEGEPLQYIVGDQEFFGRVFEVKPGVLIPRPETELLVEAVLQEGEKWFAGRPVHVVDVGTGSGAIAVTLALEQPRWQVTAIDISEQALSVARQNARKFGVEKRIRWVLGSFLEPLEKEHPPIDILVSNPPYIRSGEIKRLDKTVSCYEPRLALDGGADGLEPYRRITRQLSGWPEKPRLVAFEIGADQGEEVCGLVRQMPHITRAEVRKDLAGRDRMVLGWFHLENQF
ncbi:peptide chain release factor N(5)-glutamine methyltransferase [Thermoactinomyces intermedius]|jgi:release factor glutamine methyltransferase|uniref:Release factor glutamine methyltransferase n=1 Tax=Thermoactinomyces intermedius TaxID=2024 RepID=A0A8I1A945_THEIN|nr:MULTISPECIES: peptide chain release factor N(5)-glutamine methyltransferase [Thermoactinomyces]MBA4548122.1 peptide chain release factor N(5)-glutamine methyltransferase [Thermoactinomyces intermedius]MBA4835314.1 peptide chain release factor N(5)-glutamine methyltransferase [Thermoactinomyces intermedius]MBH8594966.1 peptide chain release factor N(5)-glutamine methyltransferase [Thermoactinomyces intermedius]MBH8600374.1 peptide chain release factor N(5)-glutamine methyltransferase [Thermoa